MANIDFPISPAPGDTYSFNNSIWVYNGSAWVSTLSVTIANAKLGNFGCVVDNTPNPITTGVKSYIAIPYSGSITSWSIFGDQSGTCVIDVWKTTYAGYPGSVANTITGGSYITLTSTTKNTSSSLGSWTTTFSAGDIFVFNVNSTSVLNKITIIINVSKT